MNEILYFREKKGQKISNQTEVMAAWKLQSKKNGYERDFMQNLCLLCIAERTESMNFLGNFVPTTGTKMNWMVHNHCHQ